MTNPIPPVPGPAFDPQAVLATGVHACPGVYALLLGSGISTGAHIPTGWQVVADLVQRAAAAKYPDDEHAPTIAVEDPDAWWLAHGNGAPLGYSDLLEALGPTPSARQALLSRYFEPDENDRAEGRKLPSDAHKAIARLAARGSIRVILTTNFDRLLERALEEEGVQPQVIQRPEQVRAATPLRHAHVTIVKLHGDYKDLEQRNTVDELSSYPAEYDELLDRILDEYGLIVSGWSGDWDHALGAALQRRATRRYPVFWSAYSALSESAARLVAHQQATVIMGLGADQLFAGLVARLDALDALKAPQITRDLAVARIKRALPVPSRRIELFDLVDEEAHRVQQRVSDPSYIPVGGSGSPSTIADVEKHFDTLRREVDTLLHMLSVGVFHDDGTHTDLWLRAITTLMRARTRIDGAFTENLDRARLYPALLALWVAGVASIHGEREEALAQLLTVPQWRPWLGGTDMIPAVHALNPVDVVNGEWVNRMPRWALGDGRTFFYPQSHLLRADAREPLRSILEDDQAYEAACDRLECLASVVAMDEPRHEGAQRPWYGEFVMDSRSDREGRELAAQVADEIAPGWALLRGGAFGGDTQRSTEAVQALIANLSRVRRW